MPKSVVIIQVRLGFTAAVHVATPDPGVSRLGVTIPNVGANSSHVGFTAGQFGRPGRDARRGWRDCNCW